MNYINIAKAIEFYKNKGFIELDVPWFVDDDIAEITKPIDSKDIRLSLNDKILISSAELGFLQRAKEGRMPKGFFQSTSPCFRDEVEDSIHKIYFMKNELICTDNVNEKTLGEVIDKSLEFFSLFVPEHHLIVVKTEIGWDIVYKDSVNEIELGSYGIRKCQILHWIYGTGCAEPRLSYVVEKHKEFVKIKKNN